MQSDKQDLIQEIKKALRENLPDYKPGEIKLQGLPGLSNQTFKLVPEHSKPVFVKILSPLIDRQIQGKLVTKLSKCGLSPKCYFTSQKFRIEELVQSGYHPKSSQVMDNQQIFKMIIQKMGEVHQMKMSQIIPESIFCESMFSQKNKNQCIQALPHSNCSQKQFQNFKNITMQKFQSMKGWVRNKFNKQTCAVMFCHNDLNNLNIMLRQKNENEKQVIFIDYEYAAYNYIAYDIANTLNQTCFSYGSQIPGFKLNRKLSIQSIRKACSLYKNNYQGLDLQIGKMLMLVNYYWALWSIKTRPTSSGSTFSYVKHGMARIQLLQYYREKFDS